MIEAGASAEKFGFKAHFCNNGFYGSDASELFNGQVKLLVPTALDTHPDHKDVNRIGRRIAQSSDCELFFYSVDMTAPWRETLPPEISRRKKKDLNTLFPSQSKLLEDERYHLFEGITENETQIRRGFYGVDKTTMVTIQGYSNVPDADEISPVEIDEIGSIDDAVSKYWLRGVTQIVFAKSDHDGRETCEVFNG